ncbi:helix-turn-helix domain-containing protein [Luteimonas dalianensis]|uniref:helix-turn-helix domain-containing protein n=1 Tax=Luteimonas dalianensis TaxID=1148196 RepID=UPI003BF3CC8E
MNDATTVSPDLVRSARDVRDWTRQQLADAAGIDVAAVTRLEEEGKADAATLRALSAAVDIPFERLAASTTARRHLVVLWIGVGLAALFLFSLAAGYRFGSDVAKRDNYRDCVAEGRTDCVRE